MSEITLVEAVNLALHHEMAKDNNVIVLGEDVGDNATFIYNGTDWNVVGIDLQTLGA